RKRTRPLKPTPVRANPQAQRPSRTGASSWMGCCTSPTARSVSFNSDGSVGTEGAFGGFAGICPNALDHRGEAVGALRREVLLEPELGQDPAGIDCENLL